LRTGRGVVVTVAAVLLSGGLALAQPGFDGLDFPPAASVNGKLLFHFEGSTDGWRGLDGDAGVSVETAPISVKEGKGALRYGYPVQQGVMSVLCRSGLSVAGAKSVSFWIKTSRPGMFGLALIEKDGSNYFVLFGTRTNAWQKVSYDLDELQLSDDSKDENAVLDADQLSTVGLVDGDVMKAAPADGQVRPRSMWIDEVAFSPETRLPAAEGGHALVEGFEELSGRWAAIRIKGKDEIEVGTDAVLKIANGDVKEGAGALEYQYAADPKTTTALFGSTTLRVKQPRSVRAWIKTSVPTMLAWVLSERDGSRYMATVPTAAGEWKQVRLGLSDFALDNESTDENKQLDGGQVNSMGFLDVATMFGGGAAAGEANQRTLWLDGIEASEEEPPARYATRAVAQGVEVVVDSFEAGVSEWLSLTLVGLAQGTPTLALDKSTKVNVVNEGAAEGKGALRVEYFAPEGGLVALLRSLGNAPLGGATQLRLWIKSKFDANLMLQLEEQDGSGYNHQLDVGGGGKWQRHELAFVDCALADDKVDENGKLDMDQVRQLLLIDMSGAAGERGENVLWLDDVAFFVPEGKAGAKGQ